MLGADVRGYALKSKTENDLYNLIDGDKICHSEIADIRDRTSLLKAITDFQPDFIFHLAAQPLVRLSYEIPAETFEVNAIGTANLLDAVKLLNKKCCIVLITTDKVYQNNEWDYPYREIDRLGGYDPYSASKACTELVIDSYRNSFFNESEYDVHKKAIAVGRAGNVIGGGDWSEDRLIPDIVRAFMKNEKVSIRNPKSVRPWQHVLEPIFGYLLLGSNLTKEPVRFSGPFNFGPQFSDALPVAVMLELAIESWGGGSFELIDADKKIHEAGLLKLDISKSMSVLNWFPKLNAKEAVQSTISWYQVFSDDKNLINSYTERQILKFIDG